MDLPPGHWPAEIERASRELADAKEALTLMRKLEAATVTRMVIAVREKTPSLSKVDARDQVLASEEYEAYVRNLATIEKAKVLAEGRMKAAEAQHEAARTYEASRRAASYGR